MRHLIGNGMAVATILSAFAVPGDAAAFHDPQTFVRAPDQAQWSIVPAGAVASLLTGSKDEGGTIAPVDHPVTKRFQHWLDLIHGMLQRKYPAQLGGVPRPRAFVLAVDDSNAFVSNSVACIDVPTRVVPPAPAEGELNFGGEPPTELHTGTYWGLSYGDFTNCQVTYGVEKVQALIAHLAQREPRCSWTWDGREITVAGTDCPAAQTQDPRPAKRIAWDTSADVIFFYSGTVPTSRTEAELVHMSAHELGHYYRNHMGRYDGYEYFYKLSPYGQARKPVLAVMSPLRELDYHKLERRLPHGFSLAGKLHPGMQRWVSQDVLPVIETDAACKSQLAPITSKPGFDRLVRFAGMPVKGGTRENERPAEPLYLELEAAILDCGKNLVVSPEASDKIRTWLSHSDLTNWQGMLLDILDEVNRATAAYQEAQETFLNTVNVEALGFYTQEEEADNLMVEILSMLGFTPDSILSNELAWMFTAEAWRKENIYAPATKYRNIPMAECKSLFQAGWPSGPVRLGRIDDLHHDNCFRFYMTALELKAHDYRPGTATQLLNAQEFELLQGQARGLLGR